LVKLNDFWRISEHVAIGYPHNAGARRRTLHPHQYQECWIKGPLCVRGRLGLRWGLG
jgi:hypothetical protein